MSETVEAGSVTTDAETDRCFSWETALMRASPFSVWLSAAIIAVLVFASYLFCAWWNDLSPIVVINDDATLTDDAWTALCMSLLWGAIFGVAEYSRITNLADLQGLEASGLEVEESHLAGLAFGPTKRTRAKASRYGLIGIFVGAVFYNFVYQPDGHPVNPLNATLTNYWFILMTLALFVEIFRNFSYSRGDTISLLRNLDHRLEIDFFDIGKLDGLGRIALRRALPWLIASAIVFLMLFGQGASALFWVLIAALMAFATFVFATPMWRVHILIDKAKNLELKRLRSEIATKRLIFIEHENVEVAARLTALLALEEHLERVREWPLDIGTIVRFCLYFTLPLGSWLGGALVERALNLVTG